MTLILIIIFLVLVSGIALGILTHVPGSSRVPPRPRPKAPQGVKEQKKSKKYI